MREIDLVRLLSLVFAMKQCSIEGLKFLIDAGEASRALLIVLRQHALPNSAGL